METHQLVEVQLVDYNGHVVSRAEAAMVEWHLYMLWLHGTMTVAIAVQPGFHNLGKHDKICFCDTFYCVTVLISLLFSSRFMIYWQLSAYT